MIKIFYHFWNQKHLKIWPLLHSLSKSKLSRFFGRWRSLGGLQKCTQSKSACFCRLGNTSFSSLPTPWLPGSHKILLQFKPFFRTKKIMHRAGPSSVSSSSPKSKFLMMVTGEISVAELTSVNTIYCKYFYVFGPDWRFIGGIKEGISATSSKGIHHKIALNTPIEATFSSTNPFKWPQIVLACYGPDVFGNDVIRGYGSTFLPTVPGR